MRLYGPVRGYGSQAQVTRGFQLALGERIQATVPLDEPLSEQYLGATAQDGVFTGRLDLLEAMRLNAGHTRRWVMVVPNSNQIGVRLSERVDAIATHVLTPSGWAEEQLTQLVKRPITVVPHGVFPEFCPQPELQGGVSHAYDEGQFSVLHFSTSAFGRKGTEELVHGWLLAHQRRWIPEKSLLCMALDREALMNAQLVLQGCAEGATGTIVLKERSGPFNVGLKPEHMSTLYQLAHLVIQPSRGEGFGLVPLEARASGVPVAATLCTGHSEHMTRETPGVSVIEHGDLGPLDDLPSSSAPTVSPDAIADALKRSYENWPALREAALAHALSVQTLWSWPRVSSDWISHLED